MRTSKTTILASGAHLPPEVRLNDWWSADVVRRWSDNRARRLLSAQRDETRSPGAKLAVTELARLKDDPFLGAKRRHVLARELESSDMEAAAGRDALARGGVDPAQIDLLLVSSLLPDRIGVPNAFVVHDKLGLGSSCLAIQGDAACNSLLAQLELADAMITSGAVQNALVIQSACTTRVGRQEDPSSAWFGDAATALLVGRCRETGIAGRAHVTDSSLYRAFHVSTEGGRWYDPGAAWVQLDDPETARKIVESSFDCLKTVSERALHDAGWTKDSVQYYGGQPATAFALESTRRYIGLENARCVETYPVVANVAGSSLPMVLAFGEREGLLRSGDRVLLAGGGAGGSWSSMALVWNG